MSLHPPSFLLPIVLNCFENNLGYDDRALLLTFYHGAGDCFFLLVTPSFKSKSKYSVIKHFLVIHKYYCNSIKRIGITKRLEELRYQNSSLYVLSDSHYFNSQAHMHTHAHNKSCINKTAQVLIV